MNASKESKSGEHDAVCEVNGMTEGEDTAMDAERDGDEDVCEVETPSLESESWPTQSPNLEGTHRIRSNSHTIQGLVHTVHDVQGMNSSPHHPTSKKISFERASTRDKAQDTL